MQQCGHDAVGRQPLRQLGVQPEQRPADGLGLFTEATDLGAGMAQQALGLALQWLVIGQAEPGDEALFDALRARHPGVDTLSMGMSDDWPVAVAEGATLVRVGSALFGARPAKA